MMAALASIADKLSTSGNQTMSVTFILCIRKGNTVMSKRDLPYLYKHKDIGFEDFEDFTKHHAEFEDGAEFKASTIDTMRWYSAGKGLKVFMEIKAKIAAGERFELPRETVIQISKEIDMAIKDLVRPAKDRLQFHLSWSK